MTWVEHLSARLPGRVSTDAASRLEASTDFGRIVERQPLAVVRPGSTQDVANAVKFAGEHSLRLAARGAGHSQNAQSLSPQIVLDVRGLDRVINVDAERCSVTCEAGTTWRALLETLLPLGLSPPVLTNNLDVTVGGTLSTAGLGVASWRRGTQADHCLELEVITGDGRQVRCSAESRRDLFDAVRAGLGWFGVITEVTFELRRHQPNFQSFYLLYDNLPALLGDLRKLIAEERFDYLESWCTPLPQGFRKVNGARQLFAQWFYPLQCTSETGGTDFGRAEEKLDGLGYYRHTHTEVGEMGEFFTRLDPLFDLWKAGGFWDYAHPWVEAILPWDSAAPFVSRVVERIPSPMLAGGHVLLWPASSRTTSVPLMMRPASELVLGFGLLPAVPRPRLASVLPMLREASQATVAAGGKRYASGWLDFDAAHWETHFGSQWSKVKQLKRKFDPLAVFGGFPLESGNAG